MTKFAEAMKRVFKPAFNVAFVFFAAYGYLAAVMTLGAVLNNHESGALGELASEQVDDLGDLRITGWSVAQTPSDEKFRGNHRMVVEALGPAGIKDACSSTAMACASPWANTVHIPNPCLYPDDSYASLLCHEMAHLKGWEHEEGRDAWTFKGEED